MPTKLLTSLLALLCASLVLSSCALFGKQNFRHRELDVRKHTFGQVWRGFDGASRRQGFLSEPGKTDRGAKKYESRWIERIAPFRRGRRFRLAAEFVRPEDQPAVWRIRYYVETQRVDNLKKVMNPEEDDWEPAGQDGLKEDVLMGVLRGEFGLGIIERRGR